MNSVIMTISTHADDYGDCFGLTPEEKAVNINEFVPHALYNQRGRGYGVKFAEILN
ncbi:MAG: hypothetical protein ACTSR8_06220 [Promethearchaeota archaeon]